MTDPSGAVAYVRVSTSDQEIGPEAQIYAIKEWCETHGIELMCEPFVDHGVSGAMEFDKRPALLDALDAIEIYNAEILVAHKRDRIARDRSIIGHLDLILRRRRCRICTTDHSPHVEEHMSPMVKAMEGMQDIFAEFERSMIRARTKAALQVKRRRGERVGTIPYGYRLAPDGVHLRKDAKELRAVALIKRMRAQGTSLRAIGAELERLGHKPRSGGKWHASSIKSISEFKPPTKDGDNGGD